MTKNKPGSVPSRLAYWISIISVLFFLLMGTASLVQAAPARQDKASGEAIFKAKCVACHTFGGGKLVGPDLKGITTRRELAWLTAWIKSPDIILASGDPIATKLLAENNNIPMSNLGLSDADVANLIAYFQSADAAAIIKTTPAVVEPTPIPLTGAAEVLALNGDPVYGEKYFTGAALLTNTGTPCIACHSVNGVGLVGGGTLGPDQTHVYSRLGRAGLASVLGTLPFPTMQGVFAEKPLTITEQADLLAFFAKADKLGTPVTQTNHMAVIGTGFSLAIAFFIGMVFFWPRQRLSLAERLRKNGKL